MNWMNETIPASVYDLSEPSPKTLCQILQEAPKQTGLNVTRNSIFFESSSASPSIYASSLFRSLDQSWTIFLLLNTFPNSARKVSYRSASRGSSNGSSFFRWFIASRVRHSFAQFRRAVGNGCGGPGSALSGTATFGWEEFPGHDIGRRIS
ncbi:hypothetical protein YC2023_101886 [Brassica napus]